MELKFLSRQGFVEGSTEKHAFELSFFSNLFFLSFANESLMTISQEQLVIPKVHVWKVIAYLQ